ncbi:MAG TPA: Eco57I restriction-modification methylase domain-containing protein [Rhodoferax sp.]|nr:Eco57I restriction-modification methylase domain-containing protein [Rhodoferax sp.]
MYRRIAWNPYDHHSVADFFDPGKMFGPALDDGFDVVIGNPPYVQIQKFSPAHKAAWVDQKFKTYTASADIYCLFFERGVRLLKDGGQLSYITSNKWMRAGYGEKLRDFFCTDVAVEEVIDFGGVAVFNAAMVDTAIVRLAKAAPRGSFPSSVLTRNFSIQDSLSDYVQDNAIPFVRPVDGAPSWVIMSPERFRIKCAVEQQGVPLEKWQLAIWRGILTGYNEAFYISTTQRDAFIAEDPRCVDLIVPLLRGRYVDKFVTQWDEAEDEKWMIATFPALDLKVGMLPAPIARHMQSYRTSLQPKPSDWPGNKWQGRKAGTYEWFETQDPITYHADFQKPKVIYPEITKRLGFFLDKGNGFYPNNKAFILTSEAESLTYLTAVLNSTVFRCCFMDNFPNLGEDRRELRKIFMDKIPVKKPTAQQAAMFEALVPMVQATKAESQKSDNSELKSVASFLEEVIDACVMEVYFADDMAEHRLGIMAHVTPLLQDFDAAAPPARQVALAQQFYAQANDSKHPIRNILIRIPVDSPDLLAVIQREGAV